jgi:hypothetical protein
MNHLTPSEIDAANAFAESFRELVHGQVLPATSKIRASAGALGIAQEHHRGILLLLSSSVYASAFALVRPLFEAYVRGEWLGLCASETQVDRFLLDKELPSFQVLVDAVESIEGFDSKRLSGIKQTRWAALCGYTHTGGIHVQRWQTEESIESNYSCAEVLEVLHFAELVLALSAVAVLQHAGDRAAIEKALGLFASRTDQRVSTAAGQQALRGTGWA